MSFDRDEGGELCIKVSLFLILERQVKILVAGYCRNFYSRQAKFALRNLATFCLGLIYT